MSEFLRERLKGDVNLVPLSIDSQHKTYSGVRLFVSPSYLISESIHIFLLLLSLGIAIL